MQDYTYWPKSLEGMMFRKFNDHIPREAADRMTDWGRQWRMAICQAAVRHADGDAYWTWIDFRAGSIAWGNSKTISFRKIGNVLDEQFPALNLNTIDKVVEHALSGPGGALVISRPGSQITRMRCPIIDFNIYDFVNPPASSFDLADSELFKDHIYALSFLFHYHFNAPAEEDSEGEEGNGHDDNDMDSAGSAV